MAAFDVLDGIRSRYHRSTGEIRKVSPALHNKASRVVVVGGGAGEVAIAKLQEP
jgi:spermidine synthase